MHPLILIPARMRATRLPGKPLADIGGKPMIVHVWERAVAADAGEVAVATDSEEIARAVTARGGRAVMTRAGHASGSDRIFEALSTLDPHARHDIILNVQGDMPTLEPSLLRAALQVLEEPRADIATLAAPVTDAAEIQDPAVVKIALSLHAQQRHDAPTGTALYFSRAPIPHGDGLRYHHIGLYAYRRKALERFVALPPSPLELQEKLEQLRALEAGLRIDVAVINTVPLGVDTPEGLEKARRILTVLS
ncbi:MAG: 3-deoxy-manno-octulosonate cytidylyltransferase [Alphaproteobacteria bacterium]|nr:3-deoxy-manno-octulosonate cytidylyltransferase [Alphaproteobacteria bacterium]